MKFSILLLDKEEGRRLRRFRGSDASCFQIVLNKFPAHVHLLGVQWIYFCYFQYQCFFQFDGVIKVSSGGKNIEGSFGEDIGIVSILRWEDDIVFLGGNSKLSGQSSLSNVFVIEQDSLFYPINVRIVFCSPGHS